jgi:peroxiredoxin
MSQALLPQVLMYTNYLNVHLMKPAIVLLFLCSCTLFKVSAQELSLKPFTLEGSVGLDSGTVVLRLVADSSFYNHSARQLSATIKNKKFTITGSIPQPTAFQIMIDDRYVSDALIILPGKQAVSYNSTEINEKLFVNDILKVEYEKYTSLKASTTRKDAALQERQTLLKNQYPSGLPEAIKAELDAEMKSIYEENDRALLSFVAQNPDSYLGLWLLIRLSNWGYESIFDDIFENFSTAIKQTAPARVLSKKLVESGKLAVGKKFPYMNLLDKVGNKTKGLSFDKSMYTLVDFWYTNCGPCRAQFPSFKQTYKKYRTNGFELIGISTDAEKYRTELPKVIKELDLSWMHYWDLDGKGATALSIKAFPSNFLLDQHGTIIEKNISPAELAIFLQKNL